MNLGHVGFAAVPVLLSLYKVCKPKKTILQPEHDYDFIVVGGKSSITWQQVHPKVIFL
jgi:hypothetical protein